MIDMDKTTWIPIGESRKQTYRFKELNGESTKQVENKPDITKAQFSVTMGSLWQLFKTGMFNEAKKPNATDHEFFKTDSWEDFKKHGRMIAQFMGAEEDKINATLDKMEKMFADLGGEGGVQKGFDDINKIETILQESGIAASGSGNGVIPEIKIRHFLDLLSEDSYGIGKGKSRQIVTQTYDTGLFIQMILGRKNRTFSQVLNSSDMGIRDILNSLFKRQFKGNVEEAWTLFRKIVRAGNYKKNGAEVGKSEIALALFFGDCKLPEKKGDILLTMRGGDKAIEMKGKNAVITNRTILYTDLKGMSYNQVRRIKLPPDLTDRMAWKKLQLSEVGINTASLSQDLDKKVKLIDKLVKDKEAARALKFKVLFGALLRSYFTGRFSKNGELAGGFDMIVIMNTDEDAKTENEDSPILNVPLVKVEANKSSSDWYTDGISILNNLSSQGINVTFLDAHGQGGFKAIS